MMTTTLTISSVIKKILLVILVFAGLYYSKGFLMPLCIGGILATLFLPFCNWMERKNLSKGLAAFLCLFTLSLIIAGFVTLLSWKISDLIDDFALIKQRSMEVSAQAQDYIFDHLGISVEEQLKIIKKEQPSYTTIMQMVAGSIAYLFTNFILVIVYFVLLLYYRAHIKDFLLKLVKMSQRKEMGKIMYSASKVSQQYLVGLSKMIVCLWVMYGIGFSVLGVENAIFFAILCGLLEIIPFVGNITGTTLTLLVTAMHGAEFSVLVGIAVVYGTVQFIQGWLLEPLILGPQVRINSLFTIIALVLGELLWGIPGIILAIPVTAIFKIICDHIEMLKPYGFLVGEIESQQSGIPFIEKIRIRLFGTKKE
ncbi:AI-2E family transporter [Flavobacterium humi]|nr:AI-2E family transporter [Flavobacterium humi]